MISCPTCGIENPAGAQYCQSCGVPMDRLNNVACTACGIANPWDALYCSNCGTLLGDVPVVAAPAVAVEHVGFGIRLVAQIADFVVLVVALVILSTLAAFVPFVSILYIPLFIYGFYRDMKEKTPGKILVGIKVVNQAGEEVSFWRRVLREVIGKFVSGFFLGLGYISVAFDAKKQAWHDKIAGTYVVRAR